MQKLFSVLCAACFALLLLTADGSMTTAMAQLNAGPGFKVSWTLDPRDFTDLFPRGPAFGVRSVLAGMDFDGDGHREFLFTTDETLAPGGPDPGVLDVYLYENTGNDAYEHVWHYSMPEGTNSLPALAWGDIDGDGKFEIYFGVPTLPPNPVKLFIFEQGDDLTFPAEPTLTWDFGRGNNDDFRPSGFQLADVDADGDVELITVSRTGGRRELVVAHLDTDTFDEFAAFAIEFEVGNDILGGGSVYDAMVVDFDGDGLNEIWVNTWDNWSMAIFEADSADSYSLQVDLNSLDSSGDPGSFNSHDLYFQDIDGDGKTEGWFPMTNGRLYFLDDTDDVSTLVADDLVKVGIFNPEGRSRGGSVGDVDNDGLPDIIASHGRSERICRIEYQEIGSPADSSSYEWTIILDSSGDATERYYPLRIAPADLDGDGLKEVVCSNLFASDPGQPMIVILEYDPSSATTLAADWELRNTLAHTDVDSLYKSDNTGNSRTVIAGMDMDQDGKKEAILTDYGSIGVRVFEYDDGQDVFELVWTSPPDTAAGVNRRKGRNPRVVTIGDMDGDDKWEIIFPLASEPSGWYVYEWDGVQGSDNFGTTYSSIINTEIDTCCGSDFKAFLADHDGIPYVKDVDGDGKQEILLSIRRNSSGGKRGLLVTSVDGDIEHNAGGGGFETWTSEFFVDRGGYGGGSPYHAIPADLDGDGGYEIVNHTWNFFNFYNVDVTGADTYQAADPNSATRNFRATEPADHVALFGGGVGDVDKDGNDEVYFANFNSRDLWVVDYSPGDDVLAIDGSHVVKVVDNFSSFAISIFDVDKNGRPNILSGAGFPKSIVSAELVGNDPRDPAGYQTQVIYTGEPDAYSDIEVTDSLGVVTTTQSMSGRFVTKVQGHINGEAIDFDNDGDYEIMASFQSNTDSITTLTRTWNAATGSYDSVTTKIANPKSWSMMRFEFTGVGTGVQEHDVTFITPDDYQLAQNYPNPFNPSTTIEYVLPINKQVTVKIYNIMGQVVKTLVDNELQTTGRHKVVWNGLNNSGVRVATGTYIYTLEFGNFRKTKRMMLVK